jgi:hypothetical protein
MGRIFEGDFIKPGFCGGNSGMRKIWAALILLAVILSGCGMPEINL